jgi:hypothetical protein
LKSKLALLALLVVSLAGAQILPTPISSLPQISTLTGTELYPLQQHNGVAGSVSSATIANYALMQLSLSEVTSLWTGTCNSTTFLRGDGQCSAIGTNVVTTTGSPASGNLAQFSGGTSITNGNLSGDCTTSNALVVTCLKTNGTAFGTLATANAATPPALGGTTPAAGAFTTLSATSTSTLNGTTIPASQTLLYSGGPGGTPSSLTLTNATGLPNASVIGLGTFATQNYATPPAIGGTTPAAGTFTTLTGTSGVIGPVSNEGAGTLNAQGLYVNGVAVGTGSGSVSSVGLSTNTGWLTAGGTPITTSGTLTLNTTGGQTANEFVATPNGSSGAVGLRAIVAADVPTLNQSTTGNAATATNVAYSGLTGTVPTWNQSTTGNAATATALASTPTNCGAGSAAIGVLANGNATGCFTPGGGGGVGTVLANYDSSSSSLSSTPTTVNTITGLVSGATYLITFDGELASSGGNYLTAQIVPNSGSITLQGTGIDLAIYSGGLAGISANAAYIPGTMALYNTTQNVSMRGQFVNASGNTSVTYQLSVPGSATVQYNTLTLTRTQ